MFQLKREPMRLNVAKYNLPVCLGDISLEGVLQTRVVAASFEMFVLIIETVLAYRHNA